MINRCRRSTETGLAAVLVALAIAVAAPDARASTSASPPATSSAAAGASEQRARAAFAEGLQLREGRRMKAALAKFQEAYDLAATTRTAYELGKTHMQMGHLVEAEKLFVEIGDMPPDPLQSAEGKAAREDAKRLMLELETEIPSLVVNVSGLAPGDAPPEITIDGAAVEAGKPTRVDPGDHTVVVKVAGKRDKEKSVSVARGATDDVTIDMTGRGVHDAGPWSTQRTVAVLGVTVGGILVATSVVLGVSARSKFSDARDQHCGAAVGGADDSHCDAIGLSQRQSAGTMADVATVLLALGGVGVATGAVLWLTAPSAPSSSSSPARVGVGVGPRGATLGGSF